MNFNDFSYSNYEKLLNNLLSTRINLCFRDFIKGDLESNYLILRHDVDFSPTAALRMAKLEAHLGVKATYFVIFSSSYYNLFGEEYVEFPRRLAEMGHEVGLHYDVKFMKIATHHGDLLEILNKEIDILSFLSGTEIKSIAMHNPSSTGTDPFQETNFINAYNQKFTTQISYFSDSCGAWRDNFVEHFQKNNFPMRIQLLIHPLFWRASSLSRWETLDDYTRIRYEKLLKENQSLREMWRNHSGVIQHERRQQIFRNG